MIPADDVGRVIEGAQQVRREDAGFRKQIAAEHLGPPPGKRGQGER